MIIRRVHAIIACAAFAFCFTGQQASACITVNYADHYILPTIPDNVDPDAIILKVLLKKVPDWNAQTHDEASVTVLRVVKGRFSDRSVNLTMRPISDCDIIGVMGRPGYVVLKKYPPGWAVVTYHVRSGRAIDRGFLRQPLRPDF